MDSVGNREIARRAVGTSNAALTEWGGAPMPRISGALRRGLALTAVMTGGTALAAEPPTRAPVVQTVLDCRKLEDGVQRLACYDKAVDTMAQAEAKGDLVTVDREQR